MAEKFQEGFSQLRGTARFCTLLPIFFLMHNGFAASAEQGQTVASVFPEAQVHQAYGSGTPAETRIQTEASVRRSFERDSTWVSAGHEHFTGSVLAKAAFRQPLPARSYGAYVRFSPGARTFWHIHPLGQTLFIVEGSGLTQARNPDGSLGPVFALKAGDVVTCPPGVMHWHGASPNASMMHLAISEYDQDQPVSWQGPVNEKDYREGATKAFVPGK